MFGSLKKITFQPIMDGWIRRANVKDKVNGYSHHVAISGVHIFKRGYIGFILMDIDGEMTLEKVDYSVHESLDVMYDEFNKFVNIEKVKPVEN